MEKEAKTLNVIPDAMKTSTIQVYGYENREIHGSFYNLYYGEEIRFQNLMQLLLLMENMMDELHYPDTTTEDRLFYKKRVISHETLSHNLLPAEYKKADILETFHVRVIFRQNASWQGTISCKKADKVFHFRSVLEMIKMMDNVLSEFSELSKTS